MAKFRQEQSVLINFEKTVHPTPASWLLDFGGFEEWLPKSQCEIDETSKVIEVPRWLAEKKGLL